MNIKERISKPFKKQEKYITRMLIMRFSAMGDVAMTIPVIHCLASQHKDLRITVITRSRFTPMFEWLPANVEVRGIDLERYGGMTGLTKLYNELRRSRFDVVADLHDVLRTKYLRNCFRLGGAKVGVVDKGRRDRRTIIGKGMQSEGVKTMFERYADVFSNLGYPITLDYKKAFNYLAEDYTELRTVIGKKQEAEKWIGIAPFAAHPQKVYPTYKMRTVANMLLERGYKVFLFGAGSSEEEELNKWECTGIKNISGKLGGLKNEMLLISRLDAMVCMDSANMHLASLVGTPVVGVWGATHPKAGFLGYGQDVNKMVQMELECRPCSIYGSQPCKFGDLRCLTGIAPEDIVNKVDTLVGR